MDQYLTVVTLLAGNLGISQESVWDLISSAGLVVKGVLLILAFFSVVSWGIILQKWRQLRRAQSESDDFLQFFWEGERLSIIYEEAENMPHSPAANVFRAGCVELRRLSSKEGKENPQSIEDVGSFAFRMGSIESLKRALDNGIGEELSKLERGLSFLATTGSTTPFIGLFGTVWGIMDSFRAISVMESTNLKVVAPGISEALIATAVGLFAAIPAVVAYNYFDNAVRVMSGDINSFSSEFLSISEKYLLRK